MKLCILTSSYERSSAPFKEFDTEFCFDAHFAGWDWVAHGLHKATSVRQVMALAREGFDVFVNLCDGAWEEDRAGLEVVQALERLGLAFTGATSRFYEPTREVMKRACHYHGLPTPRHAFVSRPEEAATVTRHLAFPMLVKHPNSYSSVGMSRASRVTDAAQLIAQVRAMIDEYHGALVEEFIDGREFTVLVVEDPRDPDQPFAYDPVEFFFPVGETFKHFDLKWRDYAGLGCGPCDDPALAAELQRVSRAFFVALGGAGYGRCDLRVDASGRIYLLEINPNCAVFGPTGDPGSADWVLLHDSEGHGGFVRRIVEGALARRDRERPRWELRLDAGGRYGLHATCDIQAGEVILAHEERSQVVASRARVERWPAQKRAWFHAYAWPFSDGVWGIWSDDPMQWRPINHGCDPNTWLDGLDVTARRDIAAGEELRIDYATFCNEEMTEFTCECGANPCRGRIRGSDLLSGAVARYGDHVSDYVRRRRGGRGA